jgi:hypothetical protein
MDKNKIRARFIHYRRTIEWLQEQASNQRHEYENQLNQTLYESEMESRRIEIDVRNKVRRAEEDAENARYHERQLKRECEDAHRFDSPFRRRF